ncbi:hypothetical protein [Bacillus smithii]|uniref:hypothetical protein n=1 Tax=Bacillus smithii TaxID=1479 RepID=UPI003D1FB256
MKKQFDKWVDDRTKDLFQTEKFEAIGKGDDYVFQALVFAGNASEQLSLATTVLESLNEVPNKLKTELKSIQQQLHDFKDKLRGVDKN